MRIVDEPLAESYRTRRSSQRGIPDLRPPRLCRASRRWRYTQLREAGLDEISSWRLAMDVTIDLHRFIEDLEDDVVQTAEATPGGPSEVGGVWRERDDGGRHG